MERAEFPFRSGSDSEPDPVECLIERSDFALSDLRHGDFPENSYIEMNERSGYVCLFCRCLA